VSGLTTTWLSNPVFLASLGAFTAMGVLMLVAAYFVMTKMKPVSATTPFGEPSSGSTCRSHEGLSIRMASFEKWMDEHKEDYKEIRRRIDALERGQRWKGE
jgi:hypothetical protein